MPSNARKPQRPPVVGAAEAAAMLGVSREGFRKLRRHPAFPNAAELASGPVWYRRHIREWNEEYRHGR